MQTILSYDKNGIKSKGSIADLKDGLKIWIDLVDPSEDELDALFHSFELNDKALEAISNKSKKPQLRLLGNHKFTVALEMHFPDAKTLQTEPIYMFCGHGWLITVHSRTFDLQTKVRALFNDKNKPILQASIDALYYNVLSILVDTYEQLLTSIELSITDFEQRSLYRPTKTTLEHLDIMSRQLIILRRHFWHTRDTINFLIHMEEENEDIKYLKIVYDNINQLIDLTESYRETVNSVRELYVANVSLQMNDTVKTLTIFSAILLPLTFITGFFGMNGIDLNDIAKLPAGFSLIAVTMMLMAMVLFLFFRKKNWIMSKDQGILSSVHESRKDDRTLVQSQHVDKEEDSDTVRKIRRSSDSVTE